MQQPAWKTRPRLSKTHLRAACMQSANSMLWPTIQYQCLMEAYDRLAPIQQKSRTSLTRLQCPNKVHILWSLTSTSNHSIIHPSRSDACLATPAQNRSTPHPPQAPARATPHHLARGGCPACPPHNPLPVRRGRALAVIPCHVAV